MTLRSRGRGAAACRDEPVTYGRTNDRSDEEGSGTINFMGLVVLALALVMVLDGVGVTHRKWVRLQAATDLTALAGAEQSAMVGWEGVGEQPCGAAFAIAETNGVSVQPCEVCDLDYLVILTQSVRIAGSSTNVNARARAGLEQ